MTHCVDWRINWAAEWLDILTDKNNSIQKNSIQKNENVYKVLELQ